MTETEIAGPQGGYRYRGLRLLLSAGGCVAGCIVAFYDDPATTGWGVPPAPGVGEGWTWNGYWYNGSPALAQWEATTIASNTQPVGGLRAGTLRTHVAVQTLFEGFLDEVTAKGYRVRDASGYAFRCTAGNGGWSCPSATRGRSSPPTAPSRAWSSRGRRTTRTSATP